MLVHKSNLKESAFLGMYYSSSQKQATIFILLDTLHSALATDFPLLCISVLQHIKPVLPFCGNMN